MSNEALTLPVPGITSGGSSNAGAVITYRPNYAGPSIPGTYAVWSDVMNALVAQGDGLRYLTFHDDDLPGTVVIPAGTYDMKNVVWVLDFALNLPPTPSGSIDIILADGVYLNQLAEIDGPINVIYQGTTGPCMLADAGGGPNEMALSLVCKNNAKIEVAGTQPFIRVDGVNRFIFCDNFTQFTPNNGVPMGVIQTVNAGTVQVFIVGNGCQLPSNFITGDLSPGNGAIVLFFSFANLNQMSLSTASYSGVSVFNHQIYTRTAQYRISGAAPGAANDASQGYTIGTLWFNSSSTPNNLYVCRDNTVGAAVWDEVNPPKEVLEYHDAIIGGLNETHATIQAAVADNKHRIAVLSDVTETVTIAQIGNDVYVNIAPEVTVTYPAALAGPFIDMANATTGRLVFHGGGRIVVENAAGRTLATDTTSLDASLEFRDITIDCSALTASFLTISNLERVIFRQCRIIGNGVALNRIVLSNIQKEAILDRNRIYNSAVLTAIPIYVSLVAADSRLRVVDNYGLDNKTFSLQLPTIPSNIVINNNEMGDFNLPGVALTNIANLFIIGNTANSMNVVANGGSIQAVVSDNKVSGSIILGDGATTTGLSQSQIKGNSTGIDLQVYSNAADNVNILNNNSVGSLFISFATANRVAVESNVSQGNMTFSATDLTEGSLKNNTSSGSITMQISNSCSGSLLSGNVSNGNLSYSSGLNTNGLTVTNNASGTGGLTISSVFDLTDVLVQGNNYLGNIVVSNINTDLNKCSIVSNKTQGQLQLDSGNSILLSNIKNNHVSDDLLVSAGGGLTNFDMSGNFIDGNGASVSLTVANNNISKLTINNNDFNKAVTVITGPGENIREFVIQGNIFNDGIVLGSNGNTNNISAGVISNNRCRLNIELHATVEVRGVVINNNQLSDLTGASFTDVDLSGAASTVDVGLMGNILNNILGGTAGSILAVGNISAGGLGGNPALHVSSVANI